MGFDSCAKCGLAFTEPDVEGPYADGGVLEIAHGGGLCRNCYIKAGHPECPSCHGLTFKVAIFCQYCGAKLNVD